MKKQWRKKGLLFAPEGQYDWMGTYAAMPLADHLSGDRYRIYFSGRDSSQKSHPGYIDVNIISQEVLSISSKPVFIPGPPGTFEDAGLFFSWITHYQSQKYLYYIGWNLGVKVPFRIAIGLATSRDEGKTFQRYAPGPIMDRGPYDPGFTASCCVLIDKGVWRMWYVSCIGWDLINGSLRHNYHIKYAESVDGINWRREGIVCIDFASRDEFAIARPSVIKEHGLYKMWYSYRGDHYCIGYAESTDGIIWKRKDDTDGLDVSASGWDSEMVDYPYVFDHKGVRYMLYNGNGYGKTGIGYAVYE